MDFEIVPSILSADFTRLGEEIRAVEEAGAKRIHADIMDGHYVPNISFGAMVVEAVNRVTALPIEVHLMVEKPELYLGSFIKAGADTIEFHYEATYNVYRTAASIREAGLRVGIAINPATPAEILVDILPEIDLVNILTVEPGFGGQRFIDGSYSKIHRLKDLISSMGLDVEIEIDGGVDVDTAPRAVQEGAYALVAGTSVFCHPQGAKQGFLDLSRSIHAGKY
jgi:ribulose-phosphate 3-epimerase